MFESSNEVYLLTEEVNDPPASFFLVTEMSLLPLWIGPVAGVAALLVVRRILLLDLDGSLRWIFAMPI